MTDIATALTSAFHTGSAAPVTVDDLLAAGGHSDEGWMVVVSVPLSGTTPALPTLFAGLGVSSHETLGAVPPSLASQLPTLADTVAVTQVDFLLIPAARHVASIMVTASLSRAAAALTVGGVSVVVKDLVLRIDDPLSADRMVTLVAEGGVNIANTPLTNIAFELTLPECDLRLQVVDPSQPVDIDALLAAAGISTDIFKGYDLTELNFDADVLNRTVAMDVAIANANPAALLAPNAGFGLDSVTVSVSYGSAGASASLAAQLSYAGATGDPLLFQASASYTPGGGGAAGTWKLAADCIGAGTTSGKLTLPTILEAVGIPASGLPIGLDQIDVDLLQASATLGGGSNDYALAAAFDTHLTIDGTTIDGSLSFDIDWASGGKASGSFAVDIDVDGFAVKLSDNFGSGSDTIVVSASYDNFTITGTYSTSTGVFALTASVTSDATLGSLLGEVLGCVTGNAQHRLPPPFDLVDDITLSSLVSAFEVDFTPATNSFGLKLKLNLDLGICTVSGVELDYTRGTPGKTSGFSIKVDYTVIGETGSVAFDPTAGSSAPLANTGLPLLQLNSLVGGQNVTLPGSPSDVASALSAAVAPLLPSQPQNQPVVLPAFSAGGWVLGADMLIKQQVQLRFIFDDPNFYGAALAIKAAPSGGGSSYLAPLVGLDAEISYHRISDTNGVYSATISLPPLNPGGGGSVQLPLCSVQLPRIALQIYTDGDFLIDLGFPYGLDFSNSLSVHLEEFVGSGGVYFGRLSGADQPSLPDAPQGYVGTVTEIGVGLQIGIYYGESFGPLSGSLSVTAQGLFEGTFAEIVVQGSSIEYYDIVAAVSVSGALQAEINFFIVSASLYVGINVCAQVTAIWHQPVDIVVDASIEVELEAEINLGFFHISKSFSFSATISDSFTISSGDSVSLFAAPAPQPVSLAGCFEGCGLKAAVGLWVTPVLTLAAPGQWAYVLDFAVPLDPLPSAPAHTPAPFTVLAELVLGWFVYAWMKKAGTAPASPTYDTLAIDAADLASLAATVQAMTGDATTYGFTADDLVWLVGDSLTVDLTEVQGTGAPGVAAFPLLPQTFWRFGRQGSQDNATADALARDYFLLVAHAAIAYARDLLEAAGTTAAQSVTQLMALLTQGSTPRLGDVAGMTTRFMMHGVHVGAGDARQPAYVAAGLTQTFDPAALTAIAYEVAPINGNALSISSASSPPSQSLFTPAQVHGFAAGPDIASASWRLLPLTTEAPHLFITRSVTPLATPTGEAAGSLWRLPKALAGELEQRGAQAGFLAGTPPAQGAIDPSTVTPLDHKTYTVAAVISVNVGRGPVPASGAQVYPIHAIRGRSAAALSDLVNDLLAESPPGIAQVELVYRAVPASGTDPAKMVAIPVDASLFVYVQNLSSQAAPNGAEGSAAAVGDPATDLLYALQARSLTSRGGFYLAVGALAKGLPDAAFDGDVATLSFVVNFTPATPTDTLKAYHTGLRSTAPAGTALAMWTPAIQQSRRNFMPGVFGFELELDFRDPTDNSQYGQTLNQLFHLTALAPVVTGGQAPPIDLRAAPLITGPTVNTPTTTPPGTSRFYRRTIDVFDYGKHASPYVSLRRSRLQLPSDPDEAQDPYALVGATVDISQSQVVDMFGNTLPFAAELGTQLKPIDIVWTDELEAIDRWPGLTTRYRIDGGGAGPVLTLLLDWACPAGIDDATANRLLQRYTAIFFQLARSDVSVNSTLLDEVAWPMADGPTLAELLQAQVKSILLGIAGRKPYSGTIPLGAAAVASVRTDMVFPLAVDLVQALSASVPVGSARASGFTVTSSIYPDLWVQAPGPLTDLPATRSSPFGFATALEAAFASGSCQRDFKLMSGNVDEAGNPTYWLLRYGSDGFSLSFAAPAAPASAAPPPLATQPIDRPSSTAGKGGPTGPLDVDASLRRALDKLERVLRPEVALSPGVGSNWSMAQNAKWSLAQALSSLVLDTETGAAASPVAIDAYRQAMLKDARAFYTVDGTIAYDVAATMGTGGEASEIAVYGAFGAEAGDHPPASFSPASVVLSTTGDGAGAAGGIATCFSVHDAGAAATLVGPTQFGIRALRIALRPVSVPPAWFAAAKAKSLDVAPAPPFLDGDWLHFVVPPAPIALPARTVAVPLRALPTPPVAVTQAFSTPADTASPGVSLRDLKRWDLGGTLKRRWVAQDTLEVLVEANVPPTPAKVSAPEPASLAQALADFEAAWASNAEVIADVVAGKAPAGAGAAVLQIGQQLGAIATAAAAGSIDPPSPLPAQVATAFLVDEGPATTDATRWAVTVTPDSARSTLSSPGTLAIAIANMDATKSTSGGVTTFVFDRLGAPVGATEALADTERAVSLAGAFDVIGAQSGRISYSTLRNRTLAPKFRYATPPVSLPKPLLPHVAHDTFFDITTLASSSDLQPLSELIEDYLLALLATDLAGAAPLGLQITLQVCYPPIAGDHTIPMIAHPIGFLTTQTVSINPEAPDLAALVDSLSAQVAEWAKPSGRFAPDRAPWQGLWIQFSTTVYAAWEGSATVPLLSLGGPAIAMSKVKWLA